MKAAPGEFRRAAFVAGARIEDVLRAGVLRLPVALDPSAVRVEALGAGESYAAWLATDGRGSLVFRLPVRPVDELPRGMAVELRAAPLIPAGVGSVPLAVDESSDNALGFPFLVSSHVAGRHVPAGEWDDALLARHAGQLARLHRRRFPVEGTDRLDLVAEFDEGAQWWAEHHPEVGDTPGARRLAGEIHRRLVDAAGEFEAITYAFVHADLVATNVVVGDDGVPRFIDWEWARIGDVANDLALIGGTVTGGRWYVPMDDAAIDRFIGAYVEESRSLGSTPEDPARLRARRDAWELHERFQNALHCQARSREEGADPGYALAAAQLRQGIRHRLWL